MNRQASRVQLAKKLLAASEVLVSQAQIDQAISRLAEQISADLAEKNPLLLCVMMGALPFTGALMSKLRFPLDVDYLHASRYGENTVGTTLAWRAFPQQPVQGRVVLVVDDILDEGVTLAAVRDRLLQMGAAEVKIVAFAEKQNNKQKPVKADYLGVSLPDRFVFGFGMDVQGAWRNLPEIYAVREVKSETRDGV